MFRYDEITFLGFLIRRLWRESRILSLTFPSKASLPEMFKVQFKVQNEVFLPVSRVPSGFGEVFFCSSAWW